MELQLRDDQRDRHHHPQHRRERQSEVHGVLFQDLGLGPEERRQVVVEQTDFEQRGHYSPFDIREPSLIGRRPEDQQHPRRGEERYH